MEECDQKISSKNHDRPRFMYLIRDGTAARSDVIDAYIALFSDTALHNDTMIPKSLSLHRIRHFRNEDVFLSIQ